MRKRFVCLLAAGVLLAAERPGQAQVVQLPTFNFFSVSTTVLAPDRGGTYLGGHSRARYGSTSRGTPLGPRGPLFGNRAIGGDGGRSGARAHATIIDLKEWDREVLAAAAAKRGAFDPTTVKAAELSLHIARKSDEEKTVHDAAARVTRATPAGSLSLAEILRQNEVADQAALDEAQRLFEQGRDAEQAGRLGAAKLLYKMAAKRGDTELQQACAARLAKLQ